MTKRLYWALGGSLAILFILFFFGVKILMGFSYALDSIGSIGAKPQEEQKKLEEILAPILNPVFEATNSASIEITGTGDSGRTVLLYVNDGLSEELKVPDNGEFKTEIKLQDGTNIISAKQKGENDTLSPLSNTVRTVYETDKPALEVSSPPENNTYYGTEKKVTVSGKTESSNTVTVNGRIAVVNPDGSFSTSYTMTPGDNTITIIAANDAGNETKIERKVTYQE